MNPLDDIAPTPLLGVDRRSSRSAARSPSLSLSRRLASSGRRSALAAAACGIVIAAVAVGCLPSATRGEGSGPAVSGRSGPSAAIPTPTPITGSPTPRPPIVPPTPTPAPTFLVYVVKSGDSLNSIAHRFGTTARSITFWNRSTYPSLDPYATNYRPDLLKLGWTLFLVPNDVVDEQDLPDPSGDAGEPTDPSATDPADTPADQPSDPAA